LRILGIDPGSHVTGYGVIEKEGSNLQHVMHGEV
jgi:crossover junction endodeoxyribonuclease RuvC